MNTRHLCTFEGARGGEILHRIQSYGKFRPRERSEEHTSELQSQSNLVCRLLLEKKKKTSILSDPAREHPPKFYQRLDHLRRICTSPIKILDTLSKRATLTTLDRDTPQLGDRQSA